MTRPGPINFIALLVNDSYKGLDQSQQAKVFVKDRPDKRDEIEYNYNDM